MHTRLAAEGKPGATMRVGRRRTTAGGTAASATRRRSTTSIAMLTEMIGSPTPMRIPLVAAAADSDGRPRVCRSRRRSGTSGSRSTTRCRSTARCSTTRRACARTCSTTSTRWASTRSSAAAATRGRRIRGAMRRSRGEDGARRRRSAGRRRGRRAAARRRRTTALWAALHKPELRDPRGFIIPSDQPDFPTATKFVNALLETGITVQRATRDVHGRRQALSGGLVRREDGAGVPPARDGHVRAAGSSRTSFPYPGAPPTPPVRQRRLDARVPDGRAVRSRSRRVHRAVREGSPTGTSSRRPARVHAATTGGYSARRRRTTRSSPLNRLLKLRAFRCVAPMDGRDSSCRATAASTPVVQQSGCRARRELSSTTASAPPATARAAAPRRASASGISTAAR